MNRITWREVQTTKSSQIAESLPLEVTSSGEVIGYLVRPEDAIVISDLHPAVRAQLKAREALARQGMPKPVPVVPKEDDFPEDDPED